MAVGPVGGDRLRALLVLVAALAIVALLMRRRRGEAGASRRDERDGFSPQKVMLGLAITVLENDMARRGLLTALKLMRNRM